MPCRLITHFNINHMKKLLVTIYFLANIFTIAIAQNISGTWEGTITQEQGGILGEYTFKIFMQVDEKGNVKGSAYVKAGELDIYAIMGFTGKFDGEYIDIEEEEILREKRVDDIFWCLKNYRLQLILGGKLRFEGKWGGYTRAGACIPGKIYLTKAAPRV